MRDKIPFDHPPYHAIKTERKWKMEDLSFWKSNLTDIETAIANIQKGRVTEIGRSAGNRPIYLVEYGERDSYERTANYSSALGAGDVSVYKQNKKPHVLIVSGEHGAEWEGIVASINLIHIFETGTDLRGTPYPELENWYKTSYVAMILAANPDGRARIKQDTVVGLTRPEFRKLDQGIWLNGDFCDWPECKRFHPIKKYVKQLGGYFNDDGINLIHDNAFAPMAEETKIILRTISDMAPDFIAAMHGHGGMDYGHLIPAPKQNITCIQQCIKLDDLVNERMAQRGYLFRKRGTGWENFPLREHVNMHDAMHLCSGAITVVYESDQGVIVRDGDETKLENRHTLIYEKAMTFYETIKIFTDGLYS